MIEEHHVPVLRTARYFTLGNPGPGVSELWFALHGYAQLAHSFVRQCQPLAAPHRLVVVPEALSRFYIGDHTRPAGPDQKIGASWMTREDRLNEITDYVGYLDHLYRAVVEHLGSRLTSHVSRLTVQVLGFSQGAATASRWVTRGKTKADRLILWGAPMAADLDPALDAGRLAGVEVILVAGNEDPFVTPKVIAAEEARAAQMHLRHRVVRYSGGHVLDTETLRAQADGNGKR